MEISTHQLIYIYINIPDHLINGNSTRHKNCASRRKVLYLSFYLNLENLPIIIPPITQQFKILLERSRQLQPARFRTSFSFSKPRIIFPLRGGGGNSKESLKKNRSGGNRGDIRHPGHEIIETPARLYRSSRGESVHGRN